MREMPWLITARMPLVWPGRRTGDCLDPSLQTTHEPLAGSSRWGRVALGAPRAAVSHRVFHQRSIAGVIVDFIADETLLTVIAGVLTCLLSLGRLALPQVVRFLTAHVCSVWSPSELSESEMTDRRYLRLGGCLFGFPARCPVRVASCRDRSELRGVPKRRVSLGGWQSENR